MLILLRWPLSFVLLIFQSLVLALQQVYANKVRSLLTMIGIVIGVGSVTAVIAALTGLRANVLAEFEGFGTNKIFLMPRHPDSGRLRNAPIMRILFQPEHFDGLLEHCPSISAFTRVMNESESIAAGPRSVESVSVAGIDPDWHQIENRGVILGRPFSFVDQLHARPVCLINETLRDKLRLNRDCIGQSLLIGTRRYVIVGIVEAHAQSGMFGGGQNGEEAFVPFNTAWLARHRFSGFMVVATSRSPDLSEEARAELRFFLRKQRALRPDDPDTFRIEVVQRFIDEFMSVARTITLVAAGVVGISLLVGGVGIMNIMLVSVSERTREIGLRKAVGARPSAILLQFLVEAVMLCCLGGLLGVIMGHLLTRFLAGIPAMHLDKAYIPTWAIAMSFGFAATVGLIFGMFPAIKAARLDPIDALRHE